MKLAVFPAADGDCLLLTCGGSSRTHILVDGGRRSTYSLLKPRLDQIADAGERIDLLVLSHIDADHIEGLLSLIEDPERKVHISEVWYNGYDQLKRMESLGFKQGDRFSEALSRSRLPVNASFGGKAIEIPADGDLPRIDLPNGIRITILSPDRNRLDRLAAEWEIWRRSEAAPEIETKVPTPAGLEALGRKAVGKIDIDLLADGRETLDKETPNGSSIAFIVEHGGRSVLMGADAHPDLLAASVRRLLPSGKTRYRVDLLKVSHHGSKANTTRDLASALDCSRFVISTDGSRHGHPDPESLAKLIKYGSSAPKIIHFNNRSPNTKPWESPTVSATWHYSCVFPQGEGLPLIVEV